MFFACVNLLPVAYISDRFRMRNRNATQKLLIFKQFHGHIRQKNINERYMQHTTQLQARIFIILKK